jgi:TonB family protein
MQFLKVRRLEFNKSLIISAILHILFILLFPGLNFDQEKPIWVEVSVIKAPDIKERIPRWQKGEKAVREPTKEIRKAKKIDLPVPIEERMSGVPVEAEMPEMPDTMEFEDFDPLDDIDKIVPENIGKEGVAQEMGTDDNLVIAGPVMTRKLIREILPKYPVWAEEKGIEGRVELKFWVSPEGMVTSVELVKTSGYPDLDSRAIEALKKYIFAPLGKDESQEEQWGTIAIKYTLN